MQAPLLWETDSRYCPSYEDANNNSIVLLVEHGENRFLFMGDAEEEEESDILKSGADVETDVLNAFQVSDGALFHVILLPSETATIVPCSSLRNTFTPMARRLLSVSAWGCP